MKLDGKTTLEMMVEAAKLLYRLAEEDVIANVTFNGGEVTVSFNVCNETLFDKIENEHLQSHIIKFDSKVFPYEKFINVKPPYTEEGNDFRIFTLLPAYRARTLGLSVPGDDGVL